MTGFGAARRHQDATAVSVEIRTVNNRYLKCSCRLPESLAAREPDVERLLRSAISRGTVTMTVRIDGAIKDAPFELNAPLLASIAKQAGDLAATLECPPPRIEGLLALPGMVIERTDSEESEKRIWPIFEAALGDALAALDDFRRSEGAAMAEDLRANLAVIEKEVEAIATEAPSVVRDYRDRTLVRVRELLDKTEAALEENDLIREVSLFADRCDINEEITRLRSHIDQFRNFLDDDESQGRKLDFLTQELNREVNTIGSKANNVTIAHRVVEMKAAVEKIREILQNIE